MKALVHALCYLPLSAGACMAQKVLPFDNLSMAVTTWPKTVNIYNAQHFAIQIGITWNTEMPKPDCKVFAQYTEFGPGNVYSGSLLSPALITAQDIRALGEAANAATEHTEFKTQVQQKVAHMELDTTYVSAQKDGQWQISIKRLNKEAHMPVAYAKVLIEQYAEAKRACLWYEKLLSGRRLPEPDGDFKPPTGSIHYLQSNLGSVQCGRMRYQAQAHSIGAQGVTHFLEVPTAHGAMRTMQGAKVRDMMVKTIEATAAAQKRDGYSFIGRDGACRYAVNAFPGDMTAELRIHPDFGYSNLFVEKAIFDQQAADELSAIIKRADETQLWLQQNQELLITPPPAAGKPVR